MAMRTWSAELDRKLEKLFPDERTEVIARKLGCGVRTVERHASALGLKKSEAFKELSLERARSGARMWYEYMRITGQKIGNHGAPGRKFEKGHRFDGEIEAKRVKAIRDRAWDERVRLIQGRPRKTGWNMVGYCKKGK